MHMPFLHLVLHLLAVVTDKMRHEVALGAVLDAEIAILEDLAQARRPLRLAGEIVHEVPFLLGHRFLLLARLQYIVTPLSTERICPVVISASSDAR